MDYISMTSQSLTLLRPYCTYVATYAVMENDEQLEDVCHSCQASVCHSCQASPEQPSVMMPSDDVMTEEGEEEFIFQIVSKVTESENKAREKGYEAHFVAKIPKRSKKGVYFYSDVEYFLEEGKPTMEFSRFSYYDKFWGSHTMQFDSVSLLEDNVEKCCSDMNIEMRACGGPCCPVDDNRNLDWNYDCAGVPMCTGCHKLLKGTIWKNRVYCKFCSES